jgi:uncharacterized protein (TIRG00374 family)
MRRAARVLAWVAACAVSLTLLAPVIGDVYGDLGSTVHVPVGWLVLAIGFEAVGFMCGWVCLRIALRAHSWTEVVVPDLAGNAASNVLPVGSAVGSVLQLRMLSRFGFSLTRSSTALCANALVTTVAGMAAVSTVALVSIAAGADTGGHTLEFGLVSLVLTLPLLVLVFKSNRPMRLFAKSCESTLRRVPWCRCPDDLAGSILRERDAVSTALAERKFTVTVMALGRTLGDYGALYAALMATGARPSPGVVLLAFVAANAAGMVPLTPGGLGFVEAGTSGALVLAGLGQEQAILAVAIYRLVSCWLPVASGAIAYVYGRTRAPAPKTRRGAGQARPSPRLSRDLVSSVA